MLWTLAQPIGVALLFAVFLGGFAKVPTDGVATPVFFLAGLTAWTFVASAIVRSTSSLVDHQRLVTRVYFPRIFLPMAAVASAFVDGLLSTFALLLVLVASGHTPTVRWWLAVPIALGLTAVAFSVGLGLASLNARYRDVRHAIPFGIQALLFATPIAYPLSVVPEEIRPWFALNPVTPLVEAWRFVFTGQGTLEPLHGVIAIVVTTGIAASAFVVFGRIERTIADVV